MNILHLSTAKSWRGGEQQIAYLVKELQAFEGVNQWVFCAKGSSMEKHCREKKLSHFALSKISPFNPWLAYRLRSICKKNSIDLVHLHDPHAHNIAILSADFFRNKTPFVLSRRVDFPIRKNWFSRYKYNHPQVKRILCVSDTIRQIMAEYVKDQNKLHTVYSGIDTKRFEKATNSGKLRKQYQIPNETALIGNVAALAPHKDYLTFVDTAQLLLQKGVKAAFFIIGEGAERMKIETHIAQLQLQKHFILTGFRNDIPDILPELDLFLMTSETEGLGTSVLDAFACKVPVVATVAGGIPELVKDGETGLLAEVKNAKQLAEKVALMINKQHLRQKLVMNAFEFVQKFTTRQTANLTLGIYIKLLKS